MWAKVTSNLKTGFKEEGLFSRASKSTNNLEMGRKGLSCEPKLRVVIRLSVSMEKNEVWLGQA